MADVLIIEVDELDPAFEQAIVEDAPHRGVEYGAFLLQKFVFFVPDTLHDSQKLIVCGSCLETP